IVTIAGTSSGMGGGPGGGGGNPAGGGNAAGDGNNDGGGGPGGGGGMGGLLSGSDPSDELTELLAEDASDYTWAAAVKGANQAAGYQLALDEPVMAIGGFNGTDPSPTLEEIKQLVAEGRIHYFIASGSGGVGSAASSTSSEIAAWVEANFEETTVGSVSLYDIGARGADNRFMVPSAQGTVATSERILIVDDEAILSELLVIACQVRGWQARGVGTGREAVALAGSEHC